MRDRIGDLAQIADKPGHASIEIPASSESGRGQEDPIFASLSSFKTELEKCEALLSSLSRQHRAAFAATDTGEAERAEREAEKMAAAITAQCSQLRARLKALTASADKRSRPPVQNITRRFLSFVKSFEQVTVRHKQAKEEQLIRRIRIVKPAMSDAEMARVLATGPLVDALPPALFSPVHSPALLADHSALKREAQAENEWMQARHLEMQALEKGVRQVHEMMADIAMLIAQQGEQIDRLEDYVSSTEEYTAKAKVTMAEATEQKKGEQKARVWWTVVAVVAAVLLLLGFHFDVYGRINDFVQFLQFLLVVAALALVWYLWARIKKGFSLFG